MVRIDLNDLMNGNVNIFDILNQQSPYSEYIEKSYSPDTLFDKISEYGINSLTKEEKDFLDEYSKTL